MTRHALLALGLVLLLLPCYRGVAGLGRLEQDFLNHREWGRRFLAREALYAGGLNVPYPPFWALAHAPLALPDPTTAHLAHLALGVLALGVLLGLTQRALRDSVSLSPAGWVAVHVLTLLVLSRPILRDLQDGGANLILTALVALATWAWTRGHDRLAGTFLGLAVALKCTALLALAWLVWRRQGRVAGAALLAATLFTVSPALWLGPTGFLEQFRLWAENLWYGLSQKDPTRGILGPEEVRNVALRPTLGRLCPAPHLPGWLASLGLLLLTLTRCNRGREHRDLTTVWRELALVLVLTLLLSPITWNPHCVAALPAVFLLGARVISGVARGWLLPALMAIALGLRNPVNPEVVGHALAWRLHSHGLMTASLVGLLLAVALCPSSLPGTCSGGHQRDRPPSALRTCCCPPGSPHSSTGLESVGCWRLH